MFNVLFNSQVEEIYKLYKLLGNEPLINCTLEDFETYRWARIFIKAPWTDPRVRFICVRSPPYYAYWLIHYCSSLKSQVYDRLSQNEIKKNSPEKGETGEQWDKSVDLLHSQPNNLKRAAFHPREALSSLSIKSKSTNITIFFIS